MGVCVIVPFYNNAGSVEKVIKTLYETGYKVVAVNDGSTDNPKADEWAGKIGGYVEYKPNRGKGYALKQGFKKCRELGFKYALSFDADGQHTLKAAEAILEKANTLSHKELENTIIVGSRKTRGGDKKGKWANDFSNFWFKVQTLRLLTDTQSGCRLYPLEKVGKKRYITRRYEFEIEVLVRSAWNGVKFQEADIEAVYDEQNRVTHFRPFKDFARISILNTFLTIAAIVYGYPKMLINRWKGSF